METTKIYIMDEHGTAISTSRKIGVTKDWGQVLKYNIIDNDIALRFPKVSPLGNIFELFQYVNRLGRRFKYS